ncbi:MAG: DNA cytosine methyltransferase [Chlorogloea purpurea SAG 13.99]|nr:DNA cytosine methyltransferase [Chlorogloea purpurea SAG 13.99]
MKEIKIGEMFCGPGGFGLGVKWANTSEYLFEHQWAIDYDEDTCQTFRNNICPEEPEKVIRADVRNFDLTTLTPIDGFIFGFPCNDFSIVGEQKGLEGEFGPLYLYGVKVIDKFKPGWFIAENVGGLQKANGGKAFQRILESLQRAGDGYNLTSHLYCFEDYGVPQTRHRIIIVGIRKDLNVKIKVPAPTHIGRQVSARCALEIPPISPSAANQELTRQSSSVVERLKYIKPGENAWNANIPEHLKLNVKGAKLSQIYKRLDPDKPAYTITGSGGGGTHVYHWEENRALTNRERARLQTFPDDFAFYGSKESVRKQIGMAVPPLGAKIIIESLIKSLGHIDYPCMKPKWKEQSDDTDNIQLQLAV